MNKKSIKAGIYLVVDPSMEEFILLEKLQISLALGIVAVQIWDNFNNISNIEGVVQKICALCSNHQTPVLINNRWEHLKTMDLDGVHFDEVPNNLEEIKREIDKEIIIGLTCGNNLDHVKWAADNPIDYISFCSMFSSSSVSDCEIVTQKTIKNAALIFNKPIFLAGGIVPANMNQFDELNYHGVAVISGIMNAAHPDEAINEYRNILNK
ncbi:Thiamine-phosphate synthase [Arenibacter antarcticus]|uniref:Thiamine phosphate synthase n=1 Tax=Arenibacter antarcticus TaxID=2040469 RepID=A0ABW5VBI0_9FLAO|nr:thiamine phosphate synthase [Arenibacter sp. H213]MCM4167553.1 thiamine phosphate synthase [Arenibacter sp. H213]